LIFISIGIIVCVVIIDQVTKNAVLTHIGLGGQPISVIDSFFYIVCHRNSGAAWGILKEGRIFFLIITPILIAAMFIFFFRNKNPLLRVALSFVIGGAIGNFVDRLLVGGVVDFLDFYIFGYNFPTFNAADSAIVFGTALLVVYSIRTGRPPRQVSDESGM